MKECGESYKKMCVSKRKIDWKEMEKPADKKRCVGVRENERVRE